jgi:hypothetical protein
MDIIRQSTMIPFCCDIVSICAALTEDGICIQCCFDSVYFSSTAVLIILGVKNGPLELLFLN